MRKFEVGKVYRNYRSTIGFFRTFECIKRTAKTVAFREESGNLVKAKIRGGDNIGPLAQEYVMLTDCAVYAPDQVQE